jgi:hypothetical protein
VDVHLLFICSIEEWLDPRLESTFNDFASLINNACETYIPVKLDDFLAETRLHSHVWLLLYGI